eukprot:GHVT01096970.1.p1 GENE.GHVT01096970.1~~GHVT01096970.1.p1  ORF type:complete len:221 (+),score=43.46 GHVT01096970.1:658-1320(+)
MYLQQIYFHLSQFLKMVNCRTIAMVAVGAVAVFAGQAQAAQPSPAPAFDRVDKSALSDLLNQIPLRDMMKNMPEESQKELEKIMVAVKLNPGIAVEFMQTLMESPEFRQAMKQSTSGMWNMATNMADENKDGQISSSEITRLVTADQIKNLINNLKDLKMDTKNLGLTPEQTAVVVKQYLTSAVSQADRDGDRRVSYEEFEDFVKKSVEGLQSVKKVPRV